MNFKRILQLFFCDILIHRKTISLLFALGVVCNIISNQFFIEPTSIYFLLLFPGLFATSCIFSDLHSTNQKYTYLMLPALQIEKLLTRWILTGVVYISVLYLIVNVFKHSMFLDNDYKQGLIDLSKTYLIMHSIIFLGALHFKKNPLIKTVLFFISFGLLIAIEFGFVSKFIHNIPKDSFTVINSHFTTYASLSNIIFFHALLFLGLISFKKTIFTRLQPLITVFVIVSIPLILILEINMLNEIITFSDNNFTYKVKQDFSNHISLRSTLLFCFIRSYFKIKTIEA
jgi:hypothetical protein